MRVHSFVPAHRSTPEKAATHSTPGDGGRGRLLTVFAPTMVRRLQTTFLHWREERRRRRELLRMDDYLMRDAGIRETDLARLIGDAPPAKPAGELVALDVVRNRRDARRAPIMLAERKNAKARR